MTQRLVFGSVLALTAGALTGFLRTQVSDASPKQALPFTATAVTKYYDASGTETGIEHSVVAVRGDGSLSRHVNRSPHRGSSHSDFTVVIDVSAKRRITLNHAVKATTTYPLTDKDAEHFRSGNQYCGSPSGSERKLLVRQEVVPVIREHSGRLGRIREEGWHAPDLGCFALSSTVTFFDESGTQRGRNTVEVTSLTPGEPDASLFLAPADYAERKPSEILEKLRELRGRQVVSLMNPDVAMLLDGAYETARLRAAK